MKQYIFFILYFLISYSFGQTRTIHTYVALCDNVNQGIVPVPKSLGNGQDPKSNLYWGAAFGLKTYFKSKTNDWQLVKTLTASEPHILERLLFKHRTEEVYMLADAFDGAYIKTCIEEFLCASNGQNQFQINHNDESLSFGGGSNLVAFLGHNGLMDFDVSTDYKLNEEKQIDVIILACYSRNYFSPKIKAANAKPLLWTNHLMAPEAYTYKAALDGWIVREQPSEIEERAAQTYNQYQKCGIQGARNLFSSGF